MGEAAASTVKPVMDTIPTVAKAVVGTDLAELREHEFLNFVTSKSCATEYRSGSFFMGSAETALPPVLSDRKGRKSRSFGRIHTCGIFRTFSTTLTF